MMGNMTDNNYKAADREGHGREHDAFYRQLDAVLAKHATAEPRAGLEQRVLAQLRTEGGGTVAHTWWRWPAMVELAVAVAIVLGVSPVWRSPKTASEIAVDRLPSIVQSGLQSAKDIPNRPTHMKKTATRHSRRQSLAPVGPKLEQFPSPRPVSEQERILESYVKNELQQAALIAEARTEALGRDAAEEMNYNAASSGKASQR
jgi:hypothetical protein